jgi:two-component system, NarL family, sensor histidine kinase DesK
MKKWHRFLEPAEIAGVGTWAIVFAISLYVLPKLSPAIQADLWLIVAFFLLYIGCFITLAREPDWTSKPQFRVGILALQLFSAFAIMWLVPVDYLPILTIIWAAALPHFVSLQRAFVITLVVVASWFTIYALHWDKTHVIFSALLYATFHFFAILMTHQTRLAESASLESKRLNQELKTTQNLLAEASRHQERTRIARDLHDLLGHHLTALIINLQVAGRLAEGDAKAKVDQSHAIAKLLLSDVREAVSTLRENRSINFPKMVDLLVANTPRLTIHCDIEDRLELDDLELAKSLLSIIQEAITNALRHSGADTLWISLRAVAQGLQLTIHDNGQVSGQLVAGNGLNGMQERVAEFAGSLSLGRVGKSLQLLVTIPPQKAMGGLS